MTAILYMSLPQDLFFVLPSETAIGGRNTSERSRVWRDNR